MRAKKRQMMSLLFALVFAVSLIGCKGETNEDKQEQLTNIEEQQGEEQQGTEVAQSDEKTDEVVEEVEEVMPENQNLLTGLADLSDKAIGKRPVAIMVNNVNDALPQYGIAGADVIFEMHVEGDLTRLMALYADYTEIPKVCAIAGK